MRKFIVLFALILFATVPVTASQDLYRLTKVNYPINVNGEELKSDLPVLNYNGNTYIPLRKVSEATGAIVEWDAKNKTVNIRTVKSPTPTPVPVPKEGSRLMPLAIGQKGSITFDNGSYSGTFTAEIAVKELIRGQQAVDIIKSANSFNEDPEPGYDYVLAKVSFFLADATDKSLQYSLSYIRFTLVSSAGKDYENPSLVEPEPKMDASLYSGASHEGWVAFKVKTDDVMPLIVFNKEYDGTGGLWFKGYN